jgi:hypothetical protein
MVSEARGKLPCDFAVYDSNGRLSTYVEAKRRFKTTEAWAREWRATTMASMTGPLGASVVLVTPDRVYVWRPRADESTHPDWTFESRGWFAPYFARLQIVAEDVDPRVFEEIVLLWLHDIVSGAFPRHGDVENEGKLLEVFRGGEVVQVAA